MSAPTYEELQERLAQVQAQLQRERGNVTRVDSYRVPKIPPFITKDPVLWFVQVEATLETARIKDQKTMAHYVIMSLDAEALASCRDLVMEPDQSEPYSKLKQRIIETFAMSAESQLRQLIKGQVLTSGKPSQILNRLRNLNADKRCDDAVIKTVFFDHLSPYVRGILVSSEHTDLDKLAKMADKIAETANDSAQCDAASTRSSEPSELERRMDKLAADLAVLMVQGRRSGRSKTRSDASKKSRKRSGSGRHNICWPHRTFGEQARACKGTAEFPCIWPKPKATTGKKSGE